MAEPYADNAGHLAAELHWLDALLRREVLAWRAQTGSGPSAGGAQPDVFRGLYLSDREIDGLLDPPGTAGPGWEAMAAEAAALRQEIDRRVQASIERGVPLALPQLGRIFRLVPFELQVLVLALAAELDLKYEKLFAYLQDDLARKRPSVDLALRLLCSSGQQRVEAQARFSSGAPFFRYGILRPADRSNGPLLSQPLVLDDLTLGFLTHSGSVSREMDAWLRAVIGPRPLETLRWPDEIKRGLLGVVLGYAQGQRRAPGKLILHLHGPQGTGRKTLAGALCREAGVMLLVADVREMAHRAADLEESLRDLFRQAIFAQAAVYLEHFATLLADEAKMAPALRSLRRAIDELGWLTFLATTKPWTPADLFAGHAFLSIELPRPEISRREQLWMELAAETGTRTASVDWEGLSTRFRFTPGEMLAALETARSRALLDGAQAPVTMATLVHGCYAQSNQRLGILARKLRLTKTWSDLTVPANTAAQLEEICSQVRRRRCVYEEWGFERRLSLGKGLCALFYGMSGVGKTMAVEIIARELSLEAYKIDLSTVVSKYIGETEKNLSRLFDEAETSNGLLFFDEADALFGKRSEVKDAHDRYANIEINYLLQRVEEFDGLVILASNLRKNIDEGFFRRMQFAVEFPMPDADHRYKIWKQHFPDPAPIAKDVDLGFLADRFPIAGGNIKNIVLNAAFLAARNSGEIRMEHLIRATRREYEKIGRVCTDSEFAPYQALLRECGRGS